MIPLIFWIALITAFSVFGSWYAKKYNQPDAIFCLYVTIVIFSVIAAVKVVNVDLGFMSFYAPAGVFTYSLTFLLTDIVNEKFGRKMTHKMVLITFVCLAAESFFSRLVTWAKPAPFWTYQECYQTILGQIPRIVLAGWVAFLASENLDAYIYDLFRRLTKGKHLWARNAFSSLPSMLVDSLLFVPIAFYGIQPVLPIILGTTAIKWFIGVINIPFMYLNRWVLYKN